MQQTVQMDEMAGILLEDKTPVRLLMEKKESKI